MNDNADAKCDQYGNSIIPAENGIFEYKEVAKRDQRFNNYGEWRIKQNNKHDCVGDNKI